MKRDYLVVIPTRNRYELVIRAIRSAFGQTVPPAEVVVVDDASTDRRYEWLDEIINHPRLTILRSERSSQDVTGHGFAVGTVRNVGLEYAKRIRFDGWIAFLDDDDEWMPSKLETQFDAAARYDQVQAFCSNAFNRDTFGRVCGYHHEPHGRKLSGNLLDVTSVVREFNPVINSTGVVDAVVARKVGLQVPYGYGEDWDYWRRVSILTPIIRVDEPLAYYTIGNAKEYRL